MLPDLQPEILHLQPEVFHLQPEVPHPGVNYLQPGVAHLQPGHSPAFLVSSSALMLCLRKAHCSITPSLPQLLMGAGESAREAYQCKVWWVGVQDRRVESGKRILMKVARMKGRQDDRNGLALSLTGIRSRTAMAGRSQRRTLMHWSWELAVLRGG